MGIRTLNKIGGLMLDAVYSQAKRIARGDPDLEQNILAFNYQNLQSANARGKQLSIGEQVNFMKHRAGELRSGTRLPIGHGRYKGKDDVYHPLPYFQGKIQIHHFDYADGENEEQTSDGRGELAYTSSRMHLEDEILFDVDIEQFTSMLSPIEKRIFLSRVAGYNVDEIAKDLAISTSSVKKHLSEIGEAFKEWFK